MNIRLNRVSKSFRDATRTLSIIDDLSIEFSANTSVGIIGRSGVGKSTLLQMIGGLDRASSGTIMFDETNVTALEDDALSSFRGANVGFVFQFHHLLPEFAAWENVAMPLLIQGVDDESAKTRALEILESVGLGSRALHRPGELSGGEQQRVAIARALVAQPRVILADEPTGNLDAATALEIQNLLTGMNRRLGSILIVVTHSNELARSLDLVYDMKAGGRLEPLAKE